MSKFLTSKTANGIWYVLVDSDSIWTYVNVFRYTREFKSEEVCVEVYDFMFADANAVVTLASVAGTGFFHYDDGSANGAYFELDSNSVIVSIGTCPP